MKDKTCIITGASSGMGFVTAIALAEKGAKVGIVCRNRERGERAKKIITDKTKNHCINLFVADLSSLSEIRKAASEIATFYPQIDVLINNAGAIHQKRQITTDGYEMTFAVNHLSYFLLTHLLLDPLKASPAARVVNVASEASRLGKINFNDHFFEKKYSGIKAYAQSKLANIMFTYDLSRRLQETRITVNCLHPGGVKTRFAGDLKGITGNLWKWFTPILRTAEKGAETIIWLATSPQAEGINGKYFKDKKQIKSTKKSYDMVNQKKLWELSEKLCGLYGNE